MNRQKIIWKVIVPMGALLGFCQPKVFGAFASLQKFTFSATASVSGGVAFSIQASTLPGTAFFGKNVVIPVRVTANPNGLRVDIVYQLLDAGGAALSPLISNPITFSPNPANPSALIGSAIIPVSDLQAIQHGGQLKYIFVARQGSAGSMLTAAGPAAAPGTLTTLPTPFATTISDHFCGAVSPSGARVSAPDLSVHDGKTAVSLAPGVVTVPGTLCIKSEDSTGWPAGPGGSKAAAIYSITLQDTSLAAPAELVLSYPSDVSGKVLNLGADPGNLGIYWLDQTNGALPSGDWRPLSRSTLDTTLHTLTGMTGHFSTFGLFAAGAIGSANLRPAERIITPNGDGINDKALFGTGIDEVKIFDVRGRRVREIPGPSPVWDGTDEDGKIVESGVYIYQYTSQGDRVSGVIGVAK